MSNYNKKIGDYGESLSQKYLINHGYIILSKNFRCKFGEIDIISMDKKINCICFTEVKSRYNNLYGRPCESITYKKIRKIRNTAKLYILKNNLFNFNFRFDVVEVILNLNNNDHSINFIENAFQ